MNHLPSRVCEVCRTCGKPIEWGSDVVAVRYGKIYRTVNHTGVSKNSVDYFHSGCSVAVGSKP